MCLVCFTITVAACDDRVLLYEGSALKLGKQRDDCYSCNEFNSWLIIPPPAMFLFGRHFKISFFSQKDGTTRNNCLPARHFSLLHSSSSVLYCPRNCINTLLSKPFLDSHGKKKKCFDEKIKRSPAVPEFALRNCSFVVAEIYSNLLTFTSYELGSGSRFIWGQCRSGKTAFFAAACFWDGRFPETTTYGIS